MAKEDEDRTADLEPNDVEGAMKVWKKAIADRANLVWLFEEIVHLQDDPTDLLDAMRANAKKE